MHAAAARVGIPLVSLALTVHPAQAQTDVALRPNTRMRAWMAHPDTSVWTGGLVTLEERYLVLRVDSANPTARLDLRTIERLERSRGRDPLLTIGLPLVGAAVGAVVGPLLSDEPLACREDLVDDPACRSETPGPLIGAAVGAIAGAVLGGLVATERWQEIPIASLMGVTVSLRFGITK